MAEMKIIRRWGSHDVGSTVDVSDEEARWLVSHHYASEDGSEDAARAGSIAPGTEGADPRAGGDWSRGGGMQVRKGPRGTDEAPDNRAHRVEGAPLADGSSPVWYSPAEIEAKREQKEKAEQYRAEVKAEQEKARTASEKAAPAAKTDEKPAGKSGDEPKTGRQASGR